MGAKTLFIENFSLPQENFLGICLGGKGCKERRAARQKARAEKRELKQKARAEKRELKLADKKADVDFKKLTNLALGMQLTPQNNALVDEGTASAKSSVQNAPDYSADMDEEEETKDNTMLYVGIGVGGLLLIGLILFLVMKK
jgi:hypothetical protein